MEEIKIVDLDIKNETFLREYAELYCQIWREPPWNEDFWTVEGVIRDIKEEMQRPCAIGYIAVRRRTPYNPERMDLCGAQAQKYSEIDLIELVGFTFGYEVDIPAMRKISGIHDWDAVFFTAKRMRRVFYVDELGVQKAFRRHGIAREISECLLREAKRLGMEIAVLRTDKDALPARKLYQNLGFRELPVNDAEYENRTYWIKGL